LFSVDNHAVLIKKWEQYFPVLQKFAYFAAKTLILVKTLNFMAEKPPGETIEKACREALEKFTKLGVEEYKGMISKLNFLIASYNADHNPVGLYEVGAEALEILKAVKAKKNNAVAKTLLDSLEKGLAEKQ
jgi:hypothetical protein